MISYAEQRTREAIRDLPDGEHSAEDCMEGDGITDEDITIRATVTVEGDSMRIDFSGTAEAVSGNINCPSPVTRSASYFALRVLLPKDILANAGTYAPLTIEAPRGAWSTHPTPLRSWPGTSRPPTASPTPCSPRSPASLPRRYQHRARAR